MSSPASAQQVITSGDVTPIYPGGNPWDLGGSNLTVGNTSNGSLTIQSGGAVTNAPIVFLGNSAGATGQVTITNGSLTSQFLEVGAANGGQGTVTVTNGTITTTANAAAAGRLGQFGGSGTVTLANSSVWNSVGSLGVGQNQGGTGTLNVLSGSQVNITSTTGGGLFVGNVDSATSGTVLIDGAGSAVNSVADVHFGAQDGSGAGTIQNGGLLHADGLIDVGGAAFSTSTANGSVTVTGAGSAMTAGTDINVGMMRGTLNVLNGATVSAGDLFGVGGLASGVGDALISGAGSSVTAAHAIVGVAGAGNLVIQNGGVLTTTNPAPAAGDIADQAGSTGTVTVTGAGSAWNSAGSIGIGQQGTGTLNILNGGTVTASAGTPNSPTAIGNASSGAVGTVLVDGAGSSFTVGGDFLVGNLGRGALTVSNGGAIAANQNSYIGFAAGGVGAATVTGAGSTWTTSGALGVGVDGQGALTISNDGQVSAPSAIIAQDAGSTGTLNIGAAAGSAAAAPGVLNTPSVAFGGGTGRIVFNHTSDSYTFAPAISGAGAVDVYSGTTALTAANTYTGGTTIHAGTLQLGAGGASGSITGDVTDNGTLAFDRSDAVTFAGVISGTGAMTQIGAGTTVLTGASTYSGGTTITAGTLQLGDSGTSGGITGDVTDNGTLAFDRSDAVTFAGVISGTGAVTQIGSGATVLTGASTYGGGTTITAGTLQLGDGGTSGSITGDVTDNGVLAFDRSDTVTFSGVISGAGAVTQVGAGTTILTADNSYSGGTTISAGALQLGNGGASGSITGDVTDNGVLAFDRSDTATFSGVIAGSGAVMQIGAGTTILNADNSYAGPTAIAAGTLVVGDASHPGAALSGGGAVTIASGATLGGFGSVAGSVTNNGALAVGNALAAFASGPNTTFTIGGALTNAGLVTLSGANPGNTLMVDGLYSGQNGVLKVSTYLNAGGALSNQITDRLLVKGDTIGSTTVVVNGSGPGALTGVPNASGGISIIQVAGPSTAAAFILPAGYVSAGGSPYQYHLNAYGPGSPNGPAYGPQSLVGNPSGFWDYRLQTAYVTPSGPVNPVATPTPPTPTAAPPAPSLPADARPQVAPQVPAYISTPTALFNVGFQDIDSLHRRLGEITDAQGQGEPQRGEVFVRAYGGAFNYTPTRSFGNYGYSSAQDYAAVEFGGSKVVIDNQAGTLRAGVAGIINRLWLTPSAVDGRSEARFNSEKLAGIMTYQANRGWYLDGIVYGGMFDGTVTTAARGEATGLQGTSVGVSLEGGYPLRLHWQDLVAEPEAEIVYQRQNFASRIDVDGINIHMGGLDQGIARVGGRLLRQFQTADGALVTPYLKANLLQGFADGGTIDLSGVGFATGQYGTAVQMGGGVTGTLTSRLAILCAGRAGLLRRMRQCLRPGPYTNVDSQKLAAWMFRENKTLESHD